MKGDFTIIIDTEDIKKTIIRWKEFQTGFLITTKRNKDKLYIEGMLNAYDSVLLKIKILEEQMTITGCINDKNPQ
jgi:hypothetical protein